MRARVTQCGLTHSLTHGLPRPVLPRLANLVFMQLLALEALALPQGRGRGRAEDAGPDPRLAAALRRVKGSEEQIQQLLLSRDGVPNVCVADILAQ